MEHVIHELELQGAGNEKSVCLAGPGNETWQIRLDYEGRDAEIGLVLPWTHREKPDSCKEGVGAGRGSDASSPERVREVRRQRGRVWTGSNWRGWSPRRQAECRAGGWRHGTRVGKPRRLVRVSPVWPLHF